jgi:hypothetical protein
MMGEGPSSAGADRNHNVFASTTPISVLKLPCCKASSSREMSRFQVSKFRGLALQPVKREHTWQGASFGSPASEAGRVVCAQADYIAYRHTNGIGCLSPGVFTRCDGDSGAHIAGVVGVADMEFSRATAALLAAATESGSVTLVDAHNKAVLQSVSTSHALRSVAWHPMIDGCLAAAGGQGGVSLLDLEAAAVTRSMVVEGGVVDQVVWTGSADATAACVLSNKTVGGVDFRAGTGAVTWSLKYTDGAKAGRCCFLNETIVTCGHSAAKERCVQLWDVRNTQSPAKTLSFGPSPSPLLPLIDSDSRLLFLVSRGDNIVRSYEMTAAPAVVTEVGTHTVSSSIRDAAMIFKSGVNVMQCEVVRLVCCVQAALEPLSFVAPRKDVAKLSFQADLFPPTPGPPPVIPLAPWLSGTDAPPLPVMSLDPIAPSAKPSRGEHGGKATAAVAAAPAVSVDVSSPVQQLPVPLSSPPPSSSAPSTAASAPVSVPYHSSRVAPAMAAEKLERPRSESLGGGAGGLRFRHVKISAALKSSNVSVSTPRNGNWASDGAAANATFFAAPWSGAGGTFVALPWSKAQGKRYEARSMTFAQAHTQPLVDLTFDPFDDHLLYVDTCLPYITVRHAFVGLPREAMTLCAPAASAQMECLRTSTSANATPQPAAAANLPVCRSKVVEKYRPSLVTRG